MEVRVDIIDGRQERVNTERERREREREGSVKVVGPT
jgi:hypothetical protein